MINRVENRGRDRWIWVGLSGVYVELTPKIAKHTKRLTDLAQEFMEDEYERAGLIVTEFTVKEGVTNLDGDVNPVALYVHFHAIVYGGHKIKSDFEKRWASRLIAAGYITYQDTVKTGGGRISYLEQIRQKAGAVSYLLKYVTKGIGLSDEVSELFKRTKLVRTWGFLYGVKKEVTFEYVCVKCLVPVDVVFNEDTIYTYGNGDEPLRVIKRPKPPP